MQRDEVHDCLRAFDVQPDSVSRISSGNICDVYEVRTGDRTHVLRIRPSAFRPQHIRADHAVLRHVRAAGFPVPAVRTADSGETVVPVGCRRFAELLGYIPHDASLDGLSRDDDWTPAARFLGQYHRLTRGVSLAAAKPDYVGVIPVSVEEKYFRGPLSRGIAHYLDTQDRELAALAGELGERLEADLPLLCTMRSTPRVVVHNDFCDDNILVRDGEPVGLIDFDFCLNGSHLVDLVEGLHGATVWSPADMRYWGLGTDGAINEEGGARFLAAYEEASGIRCDPRLVLQMLRIKVLSLVFYPGFCTAETVEDKRETLRRARRTLKVMEGTDLSSGPGRQILRR